MTVSVLLIGEKVVDNCCNNSEKVEYAPLITRGWESETLFWIGGIAFNWITGCHWYSCDLSIKEEFGWRTTGCFPVWRLRGLPGFQVSLSNPSFLLILTNKIHMSWSLDLQDGKAGEKPKAVDLVLWTIINFFLMENQSIYQCSANNASFAFL